jgi:hypothetical protein
VITADIVIQQIVTVLILLAAAVWLAWHAYRFIKPRTAGGGGCGGSCGCGHETAGTAPPAADATKGQTVFLPSDDLIARLKARK